MVSVARTDFLAGIAALKDALDENAVRAANPSGDFLRRGLTVSSFNLLETFITDRTKELADHINGGHTQFLDLPDRLQKRAISHTLNVANNKIRRIGPAMVDLRDFSRSIGKSLSAVDRTLGISHYMWLWPGSNMAVSDYASVLGLFHVDKPWQDAVDLTGRLGFSLSDYQGDRINLHDELTEIANERLQCAHVASHGVTTIWLRTIPGRVLRFAIAFDIFASVGATMLRQGDRDYLRNDKWMNAGKVSLRFVRQRKSDYAETIEGGARALHVSKDDRLLFAQACSRSKTQEAVVKQDVTNAILDWSIPTVG